MQNVAWYLVPDTDTSNRKSSIVDNRQSTAVYDARSVMMIALSEDDLKPREPEELVSEVRRRCPVQTALERQNSELGLE